MINPDMSIEYPFIKLPYDYAVKCIQIIQKILNKKKKDFK